MKTAESSTCVCTDTCDWVCSRTSQRLGSVPARKCHALNTFSFLSAPVLLRLLTCGTTGDWQEYQRKGRFIQRFRKAHPVRRYTKCKARSLLAVRKKCSGVQIAAKCAKNTLHNRKFTPLCKINSHCKVWPEHRAVRHWSPHVVIQWAELFVRVKGSKP